MPPFKFWVERLLCLISSLCGGEGIAAWKTKLPHPGSGQNHWTQWKEASHLLCWGWTSTSQGRLKTTIRDCGRPFVLLTGIMLQKQQLM